MKEIKVEELKKIELGILNYIDDYCKKNNINYWIDCGTLLGAVRHGGFIPWDDDIDIGMLREDYIKFSKEFNTNNVSNYKFCCYENNKKWPFSFGKVLDLNTILYEPDKKHGYESSVYVDVFPYDEAPSNLRKRRKKFKKGRLYMKFAKLQRYSGFYVEKKQKYNFLRYPLHLMMQIFPKDFFIKRCIKNAKKVEKQSTNLVGDFTCSFTQCCEKDAVEFLTVANFEGKKYPAPVGYDKWLKSFYGDYWKLPPIEERVSHHRFEAYHKNK